MRIEQIDIKDTTKVPNWALVEKQGSYSTEKKTVKIWSRRFATIKQAITRRKKRKRVSISIVQMIAALAASALHNVYRSRLSRGVAKAVMWLENMGMVARVESLPAGSPIKMTRKAAVILTHIFKKQAL